MAITGYHGTNMSAAEKIMNNGYESSSEKEWLGKGVYFFKDIYGSYGYDEAECWAKFVKKFPSWAVLKTLIESDDVLDLIGNLDNRKFFDKIVKEAKNRHVESGKSIEDFKDYMVFKRMDQKKEMSFEVVIALVDGGRQKMGYDTNIVRRPQAQVCVKAWQAIKKSEIVKRGII